MRLDGRLTGGVCQRPPVLKRLSTKGFQKETGEWEVKMRYDLKLGLELEVYTQADNVVGTRVGLLAVGGLLVIVAVETAEVASVEAHLFGNAIDSLNWTRESAGTVLNDHFWV